MKSIFYTLLILVGFCCQVSGQSLDYEPGYIVIKKDTVVGSLKRTDDLSLSTSAFFKGQDGVEKQYFPGDLESFRFASDNSSFDLVIFQLNALANSEKKTRFAKLLVKGVTSLYKVQLSEAELPHIYATNNTFVYVVKKEGQFYTLGQFESEAGRYYKLDKKYVGMLRAIFFDCKELQNFEFNNVEFTDKSIIKITEKYNRCIDPASDSKIFTHIRSIVKHGAEVYYGFVSHDKEDFYDYSAPVGIGFFWEVINPARSQKTGIKVGISYLHFRGVENYRQFFPSYLVHNEYSYHYIGIPLLYQHNFRSQNYRNNPFFNLGLTPSFSTNDRLDYLNFAPFITLGAGMSVGRLRLGAMIQNTQLSFYAEKILSLNLGYTLSHTNQKKP